jgi:hypothetical protein
MQSFSNSPKKNLNILNIMNLSKKGQGANSNCVFPKGELKI